MAATHLSPPSMAMWLVNQDESVTPEGYTSINAFSVPDDLESYPPALGVEDPFSKYSEDPPALIAYVAYLSDSTRVMANPLVKCDGGYWEWEDYGEEDRSSDSFSRALTNTTAVR